MLSQEAADYLARIAKEITSANVLVIPTTGTQADWEATSITGREHFYLHMRRGRKVVTQQTLQERFESNEILLRLDIDGPTHSNPDGTVVPTPHLHVYRAGFDDKWAFHVPAELDVSGGSPTEVLLQFLGYCGVAPIPPVQGGLLP